MAKILVADDNSNIQKMVGLALKDHGIEVIAVGNGEAAVRKISDVRPDLVLADVFMPVRNGYEVCKYVKEDSALKHIPVILLVGAFDPLDEQEAQRVGADGVLKKPFVPPDPLISMVKSALVRAGVAHAGFTPASAIPPPESTPAEAPRRVPASVPNAEFPVAEDESFVQDVSTRPAAVRIESGAQPLAFGSLLGTPGTETEDIPTVTSAPAHERDWRALDAAEEEEVEEPAGKSAWRRDAGAGEDEIAARPERGWREMLEEGASARSGAHEGRKPAKEKQDLAEAAEAQESVTRAVADTRGGSHTSPFAGDAWAAAISASSGNKTAVAEAEKPLEETREPAVVEYPTVPVVAEESAVREQARTPEPSPVVAEVPTPVPVVQAEKQSMASAWFSTPPSPWEAEAQKASQLASTWDAPAAPAVSETNANGQAPVASYEPVTAPDEIEVVSEAPAVAAIPEAAVETVREEAAQAVEYVAQEASRADEVPSEIKEGARETPPSVDIDAVVAKVLARMSPDVLQSVTRDILKPVVEAIVREELNSRKS